MGIPPKNALRWLSAGALLVWAVAVPFGCETDRNPRQVSSQEFIAPVLKNIRVLANKLAILKAISPSQLDSVLETEIAEAQPIGKVSDRDLVVYENVTGATVSIDLCPDCDTIPVLSSRVTAHWTRENLEEELFDEFGVVSLDPSLSFNTPGEQNNQGVTPIELQGATYRGWVLAFETSSGSLLGFQRSPSYRPVPPGLPVPEEHPNFGRGNGLLMTVVISGQELEQQIGLANPRISRIVEIEDGKLLLFFTTIRAIHLLELDLVERELADSLVPPQGGGPLSTRTFQVPRGEMRVCDPIDGSDTPRALVDFDFIQDEVTENAAIRLDSFQPLYIPPKSSSFCENDGNLPAGGSVLVYDSGSSSFLQFSLAATGDTECPTTALVTESLGPAEVIGSLDTTPPYFMSQGAYAIGCAPVLIFEETSNNLIRFDFRVEDDAEGEKIGLTADSVSFLLRREPAVISGEDVVPNAEETVLTVSRNNIRESRLYFDQGRDQLLAVHLDTGNVVVVAGRTRFEEVTDQPLADLTFIEALDPPDSTREFVRAFDTTATALIQMELEYTNLTVIDAER